MDTVNLEFQDAHIISSDSFPVDDQPSSPPLMVPHETLHIEVALRETATCRFDAAHRYVEEYLREKYTSLAVDTEIRRFDEYAPVLRNNVERIYIIDTSGDNSSEIVRLQRALLDIHVYQLRNAETRFGDPNDDYDGTHTSLATVTDLPAKQLDGLWHTLVFDSDLKSTLLHYISTIMLFSDRGVNPHLVTFHRLLLFHGPPGTGKTSLCRALAQKIAIRLSNRFSQGRLIEVNATSLFSRYFSESSKLVTSLFEDIYDSTLDEESFICVLIDEVESLTTSRSTTIGSEPSDAMRVVNVLLTQLDRLKLRPNVLILTTSNLLEISDPAFLDRADIVQYVGHPKAGAVYQILRSGLLELMRVGLVDASNELSPYKSEAIFGRWAQKDSPAAHLLSLCDLWTQRTDSLQKDEQKSSDAVTTSSMSGRSLRRLPVLAHARHIKKTGSCTLNEMLRAIECIVREQSESEEDKAGRGR